MLILHKKAWGSYPNIHHSLHSHTFIYVLWCSIHQLLPRPSNQIHNPELDLIECKTFWQLHRFTKGFIQPLLPDFACKFSKCIA